MDYKKLSVFLIICLLVFTGNAQTNTETEKTTPEETTDSKEGIQVKNESKKKDAKESDGVTTISLKFEEREFTKPAILDEVDKYEFFKIKIDNLNTYLYKVEINSEDSTLTTSLPANLFGVLDLTNLNTLTGGLSSIIKLPDLSVAEEQKIDAAINDIKSFKNEDLAYSFLAVEVGKAKKRGKDSKPEIIQKLLNDISNDLLGYKDVLLNKNKSLSSVEYQIIDYLSLIQIEKKLRDSLDIDFDGIKGTMKMLNSDAFSIHSEMHTIYVKFLGELNQYIDLVAKNDELKKKKAAVDAFYTELDKKFSEFETLTSAEKVLEPLNELIKVYNNKNFTYESLPIQRTGDLTEVTITISPRDSTTRLNTYVSKFEFKPEESPWSVSTGFYITGNPDENFSPRAVTDTNGVTTFDLVEEDNGDLEIGISTMIRYHLKFNNKKETFWHFGLGAGMNIGPDVRPRVLFGTGLAFGKKNKLIVDIGGIYMFYDKLSNAVQRTGNTAIPENYTVSASKMQLYFSLGYTISLD